MSQLDALLKVINTGVADIQAAYAAAGQLYPALDGPFIPNPFDNDEKVQRSSALVVAAAWQLITTIRSPALTLMDAASAMYQSASISVVERLNVAEILREAGPNGLHVKEIGKTTGTNPDKMGRYLRYLATRNIFREVSPDVFTNNRISSLIDTRKPVADIKANPNTKYEGTMSLAAVLGVTADDAFRGAAHILDNALDAKTDFSEEMNAAPFSRATGADYISWLETPGHEFYLHRINAAMAGTRMMFPEDVVLQGFEWASLEKGSLIVDVGGGVGSTTLVLAKAFSDLRFLVQERESVVPHGIKFFEAELPSALANGQVKFQVHDFFTAQPVKDAEIFLLRFVLHDWSKAYAQKILKQLRASALPTTHLVVVDFVVSYASPDDGVQFAHIPGASVPPVPEPLLPNLGLASLPVHSSDMQMLSVVNAQERTLGQFLDLFDGTGWKLEKIHRTAHPQLVLIPV